MFGVNVGVVLFIFLTTITAITPTIIDGEAKAMTARIRLVICRSTRREF